MNVRFARVSHREQLIELFEREGERRRRRSEAPPGATRLAASTIAEPKLEAHRLEVVRERGVEPPRLAAPEPKGEVGRRG
jgi:hypothetical protein